MLRAGAILLLLIALLQTAGKWLVFADYALNKDYIISALCENKAKTAMHCSGQCHLRKQLQKEENGGSKESSGNSQQKFQEVYVETHTGISFDQPVITIITSTTQHTPLHKDGYIVSVFHPPGVW